MKKRIVSLGTALLMLISVASLFTGCKSSGNVAASDTVKPLTLTLAMVTDEQTTDKGIAAVEEAVNQITENNLNIHVSLQFYTKDEYKDAILKKLAARQADMDAGIKKSSLGNDGDVVKVEIIPGQYREVTAYPDPYENQVDVFMIPDRDMYLELRAIAAGGEGVIGAEYVDTSAIDAAFTSEDAALTKITKYISANLLAYCNDGVHGDPVTFIPRTAYYGEYEYLLVKKDLFDKYPYTITDVKGLPDLREYLVDVAENEDGVIPLYNIYDMNITSLTDNVNVYGTVLDSTMIESTSKAPTAITSNETVRSILATYVDCGRVNGQYAIHNADPDFSQNFAAAFVKGYCDLPEQYEDEYYVIRTGVPVANSSQMLDYGFAISNYSSDSSRCYQLIQELYTNEELLNTLLYGVENVTYTKDESTDIVTRKHEGDTVYVMNEYQVGNTFLAWQNSEMTEKELEISANGWARAKQASADAIYSIYSRLDVDMGYGENSFTFSNNKLLEDYIDELDMLYDELWVKLRQFESFASTTKDEPTADEFLVSINTWLTSQEAVSTMTSGSTKGSLTNQYINYWNSLYKTE